MKIAVVGLGLIGGSFCKAIMKRTKHQCYGMDIDPKAIEMAVAQGAVIDSIEACDLCKMDVVIVCLHPKQTISFVRTHLDCFQNGSIVMDSCGVKESIVAPLEEPLLARGVRFLGCHPMAGREFSGFPYALETLYDGASFIMTPTRHTQRQTLEEIQSLMKPLGFAKMVVTSPEEHDAVIAFTSQLAHVVSNAYIKSPTLEKEIGFSAGSFLDLTRVAQLNADMWTDLFLLNQKALVDEIDHLIQNLQAYRQAMVKGDAAQLHALLQTGSDLKKKQIQKNAH